MKPAELCQLCIKAMNEPEYSMGRISVTVSANRWNRRSRRIRLASRYGPLGEVIGDTHGDRIIVWFEAQAVLKYLQEAMSVWPEPPRSGAHEAKGASDK